MRHLIALFAGSFVIAAASANDNASAVAKPAAPAAGKSAPSASAGGKPAAAAASSSAKDAPAARYVPPMSPAAQRAKEEQAELDLSEKIAARLAEMREKQKARLVAAANARKQAEVKRRQETLAVTAVAAAPAHGTHWSYEGDSGPASWARINVDWAKCGMGQRQSPIDIRDGIKVDLETIGFDYHTSSFSEIDNGHTIDVTVGAGNFITVGNETYELQGFHFHRPSEERINGKGTEMVMHLVHKSVRGQLAVVAVLLERGKQHSLIQTIWNNLPLEKNQPVAPSIVIDPNEALPERREYYTYMGSMETPPCTEGVLWLVMKEKMQASPAQMALFSRLYPLNARPVQPTSGRTIKESN
jgi:carbonic anhydrase